MPTYAAAFIARRSGGNGHIGGLVRQLDEVLYASFVASYILDANFLNFVVRCICRSRQLPAKPCLSLLTLLSGVNGSSTPVLFAKRTSSRTIP